MLENLKIALEIAAKDSSKPALRQVKENLGCISQQLTAMRTQAFSVFGVLQLLGKGRALLVLSEEVQLSNARLQNAVKNMQAVAAAQKDLYALAQQTGGGYVALSQLYARASLHADHYHLSQQKILTLTRATAQSLRISGATTQEAASATLQLSQALGAGALRGEEFRAVMESAPRLMKALADGLGVPLGMLRELAFEGRLTTEIVVDALESQAAVLEEEAARIPRTIGIASAAARDELGRVMVEWDKASGLSQKLAGGIDLLVEHMDKVFHGGLAVGMAAFSIGFGRILAMLKSAAFAKFEQISANRQLVASELAAARTAVSSAQAYAAQTACTVNAVIAQKRLAEAKLRLAAAEQAAAVSVGATGFALRSLAGVITFLGGPFGALMTAVSLGASAWLAWGDAAQTAGKKAQDALEAARRDTERKVAAAKYGTGDLSVQKEAVGEAKNALNDALKRLESAQKFILLSYNGPGGYNPVADAEKVVAVARERLAEATKLYEQARVAVEEKKKKEGQGEEEAKKLSILKEHVQGWVEQIVASKDKIQLALDQFEQKAKVAKLAPQSEEYTALRTRLEDALLGRARTEFAETVRKLTAPLSEQAHALKDVREKGQAARLSEAEIRAAEDKIRAKFSPLAKFKELVSGMETSLDPFAARLKELNELARKAGIKKSSKQYKRAYLLLEQRYDSRKQTESVAARLDEEMRLYKDALKRKQDALKQSLDKQGISIKAYYGRKNQLEQQEISAEISRTRQVLAEKQKLLASGTQSQQITARQDIARLENELIILNRKRADAAQANARASAAAERELEKALTGVRIKLKELSGEMSPEDLRAKAREPYKQLRASLLAEGRDKDVAAIDKLIDIEAAQAQFAQLEQAWERTLTAMQNATESVKISLDAGGITDFEARDRMQAIADQAAGQMREITVKMEPVAQIAGPEQLERLKAMQNELRKTQLVLSELGQSVKTNLTDALTDMFQKIMTGTAAAKEAILGMLRQFLTAMAQVIAAKLAAKAVGGALPGFAPGGHVRGRGTDTSDSIPAWLSNYEYVVRAAVVRQPDALRFLHDFNRRGMSALRQWANVARHANGGLAGLSLPSMPLPQLPDRPGHGGATVKNAVNLHVYDDPQRIASAAFNSRAGEEAFVAMLSKDPARFRQVLAV